MNPWIQLKLGDGAVNALDSHLAIRKASRQAGAERLEYAHRAALSGLRGQVWRARTWIKNTLHRFATMLARRLSAEN